MLVGNPSSKFPLWRDAGAQSGRPSEQQYVGKQVYCSDMSQTRGRVPSSRRVKHSGRALQTSPKDFFWVTHWPAGTAILLWYHVPKVAIGKGDRYHCVRISAKLRVFDIKPLPGSAIRNRARGCWQPVYFSGQVLWRHWHVGYRSGASMGGWLCQSKHREPGNHWLPYSEGFLPWESRGQAGSQK